MKNEIIKKELSKDDLIEVKRRQDALKTELSRDPNTIKINKFAGNSKYVPISIVQSYLDSLFLSWDWKINDAQVVMNGYMVRGTLKCYTVVGGIIEVDGIGAVEFQLKKDEKILTPNTLNSKAIERDIPKAESEALKNAAKKLGQIFGRNLNREEKNKHAKSNVMERVFNLKED